MLKLSMREDQLKIEGLPKRSLPAIVGLLTLLMAQIPVYGFLSLWLWIDSLKPGMLCQSFGLEGWRVGEEERGNVSSGMARP